MGRFAFKGTQYFRLMEPKLSQCLPPSRRSDMGDGGERNLWLLRCKYEWMYNGIAPLVCPVCGQIEYPVISPVRYRCHERRGSLDVKIPRLGPIEATP